jgi:hypothetical protein
MPAGTSDGVNWPLIIKRVALKAAMQLPRHVWRGKRNGHPPGAEEVEDLVQDAAACALERKHEWITDNGPDVERLIKIMMGRVSHRITDLAALHENRNVSLDDVVAQNPDARELSSEAEVTSKYGIAAGHMLPVEMSLYYSQISERAHQRLESDATGQAIFIGILEGTTKPQILAEDLGLTTREVNNTKKRISPKLEDEFQELRPFYCRGPSGRGQKPDEE